MIPGTEYGGRVGNTAVEVILGSCNLDFEMISFFEMIFHDIRIDYNFILIINCFCDVRESGR